MLVVGDIDRGGVFASFVGTMEVLAPWERKLVAGWIVNRFRGDASLLGPALDYTLTAHRPARVGRGAVSGRPRSPPGRFGRVQERGARSSRRQCRAKRRVEIAVIDLPHISNFTDFDAFRSESDVRLRIIRTAAELNCPMP